MKDCYLLNIRSPANNITKKTIEHSYKMKIIILDYQNRKKKISLIKLNK